MYIHIYYYKYIIVVLVASRARELQRSSSSLFRARHFDHHDFNRTRAVLACLIPVILACCTRVNVRLGLKQYNILHQTRIINQSSIDRLRRERLLKLFPFQQHYYDRFICREYLTYCKRCARRCCGEYKNDFSLICSDAMLDVVQSAGDIPLLKIMWFFFIFTTTVQQYTLYV